MEYTKGEWKVREAKQGLGFEVYREIAPHIVDVIAEKVLKQDARLIAAAPKMHHVLETLSCLKALKEAHPMFYQNIIDVLEGAEGK